MKVQQVDKNKLFEIAQRYIWDVETVVDIGCGIMPQQIIRPKVHICCEPFNEYVNVLKEKVKSREDRNYVILNLDWEKVVTTFPENSVDTVILTDVIEHLEKDKALNLLERSEKICRKQLVIFTPLGFLPQSHPDGIDAWGLNGGQMQEHKSGWQPEDFGEGWEIFVANGFHEFDSEGRKFDTPFGALWAIKNFEKPEINYSRLIQYNRLIKKKKKEERIKERIKFYLKSPFRKVKKIFKGR